MEQDNNPVSPTKAFCTMCDKHYVRKEDLKRHIDAFHLSVPAAHKCHECKFTTHFKRNLMRHVTRMHSTENVDIKTQGLTCGDCGKVFAKQEFMQNHMRVVHRNNENGDTIRVENLKKENFSCDMCEKKYVRNIDLQGHINAIHSSLSAGYKVEKCPKCAFSSSYKNSLRRHVKNVHSIEKENAKVIKCVYCKNSYSNKKTLRYHVKKYHSEEYSGKPILRRTCCICEKVIYGYSKQSLRSHFESEHNIPMRWENHNFQSITDFKTWKTSVEKETKSFYSFHYYYKSFTVYVCHRSGWYRKKGHNKRKMRQKGSCKINNVCPSFMKVNVNIHNKNVDVKFLRTHVGHKNELKHIRLSPDERKIVAAQIASKMPHEIVLSNVQGSVTKYDSLTPNNNVSALFIDKTDKIPTIVNPALCEVSESRTKSHKMQDLEEEKKILISDMTTFIM